MTVLQNNNIMQNNVLLAHTKQSQKANDSTTQRRDVINEEEKAEAMY